MASIYELLSAIFGGLALIPACAGFCCWLKIKIASSNDMENIHANLNHQMMRLCAKRDGHNINEHRERVTKRPTETYKKWVDGVTKIEDEVKEINTEYETESKKSKWFRFWARSNFSRRLTKMSSNITRLIEEEKCGLFLVEKETEKIVKIHAPDIKEFSTLQNPLEKIVKLVEDVNYNCMVVWGKLGIGKTAIIENLNNHEKVDELFDLVICLKVSAKVSQKNLSIEEMQQDIVKRLKLKVEVNSHVEEVALRIKERLSDKKYLLLFIDVKENIELDQIGIDLENGSKMVLTTTDRRVRCSMLNGKVRRNVIEVRDLTDSDALKMFKSALEDWEHKENPSFRGVMVQVVNICCRHPLAIRTVARSFKMRNTVQSWIEGLDNLRIWPVKGDGSLEKLYDLLNFGCNQLEDDKKDCFFYSAIYPEDRDMHTDWLLDCWAAEELYHRAGDDVDAEKVRVEGRIILDHLKTVWLLEECVRKECVRMHKLIRQAALYQLSAAGKHQHLVKIGGSLQPHARQWKDKKYISWGDSRLNSLPELQDKLIVSTLLLQENSCLERIPDDSFFEHMKTLRVLNLYCTGIASLPTSVSKLNCLKVLYLNGCTYLAELPSQIGDLKVLEVLDIRGSGVKSIPSEMKNLSKLRRLLLSLSNFGIQIQFHTGYQSCEVISNILSLEELIIDTESTNERANLNAVIDTVAAPLTRLMTLKFCFEDGEEDVIRKVAGTLTFSFPRADAFKNFVHRLNELDKFHVFIGHSNSAPQIPKFDGYQRCLRYCGGGGCGNTTISNILANSDAIELVNHSDLQHLSEFDTGKMKGIQDCLIEGCNKIETVVDGQRIQGNSVLGKLLRLYMKKLPQLKSIWKGPWQSGSLSKLITLEIRECSRIEELLLVEPGNQLILPNLRKLILVDIEKLERICASVWTASALEELEIHACPMLTKLPFNTDSAMKLRKLTLVDMPILDCISTSGWIAPGLEELQICMCPKLAQLPFDKDSVMRLRKLTLADMAILNWICSFGWTAPALEELQMRECPKLHELPFDKDSAMKLRKLALVDMLNLNKISTFGWTAPALRELEVSGCLILKELPFNRDSATRLRSIKAEKSWWEALQWKDSDVKERLSALLLP